MASKMWNNNWRIIVFVIVTSIALVYTWIITTNMETINSFPAVLQFFSTTFVIYTIFAIYLHVGLEIKEIRKTLGMFLVIFALDLLLPPLMVGMDGIIAQADLGLASIDALFGSFWGMFGISGFLLWVLTYPVMFIVMMTISIFLLRRKEFEAAVKKGVI